MNQPHLHLRCLVQSIIDHEHSKVNGNAKKWVATVSADKRYINCSSAPVKQQPHFQILFDNGTRIITFAGYYDELIGRDFSSSYNAKPLSSEMARRFVMRLITKLYPEDVVQSILESKATKMKEAENG